MGRRLRASTYKTITRIWFRLPLSGANLATFRYTTARNMEEPQPPSSSMDVLDRRSARIVAGMMGIIRVRLAISFPVLGQPESRRSSPRFAVHMVQLDQSRGCDRQRSPLPSAGLFYQSGSSPVARAGLCGIHGSSWIYLFCHDGIASVLRHWTRFRDV